MRKLTCVSHIFHADCTQNITSERQEGITTNCPGTSRASRQVFIFLCVSAYAIIISDMLPPSCCVSLHGLWRGKLWSAVRREMLRRCFEATPDTSTNPLHMCSIIVLSSSPVLRVSFVPSQRNYCQTRRSAQCTVGTSKRQNLRSFNGSLQSALIHSTTHWSTAQNNDPQ
jgi:hypothetical protein